MQALSNDVAEIQLSYRPNKKTSPTVISSSAAAYAELLKWFPQDTIALKEEFIALYLNRANQVLGVYHVSSGGITSTISDPRLIIAVALKTAAVGIIISHNHPSGTLKASSADQELTKRLVEACKLLDIAVLDHLIITPEYGQYLSFADEGIIR
jgi:DNA repair protein RadC